MTALLSLALKNWKLVAIGGLVLALVTGWGVHRVIVAGWKSDLADARQGLAVCRANEKTLEDALKLQNAAIDDMKAKADANQREAEKRAQEAKDRLSRDRERERGDDRSGPEAMTAFFERTFQ